MTTKEFCKKIMKEFEAMGVQAGQLILRKGNERGQMIIENTFWGRTLAIKYDHTEDVYRIGKTSLFECKEPGGYSLDLWSDDIIVAARRMYRSLTGHYKA